MKKNVGRNIINAEELKYTIINYAKEKKLPLELTSWLEKSLYRWLINHFSYVQIVQSKERFRMLVKGQVPLWFKPNTTKVEFIYVDSNHHALREVLDKTSEYMMSQYPKLAHKFYKMTVEQVLKKWDDEHKQMHKRQQNYLETSNTGMKVVFEHEQFNVLKFISKHKELPLEMARESALMQHCLGEFDDIEEGEGGYGAYYLDLILKGELELYSLRDEKNMPHATIALYKKEGVYWLEQIKGKQNQSPIHKYMASCVAFFNFLDVHYNYHNDTLSMGLVYVEGESRHMSSIVNEDTQQFLVAYNASFIHALPSPSKSTLWLATLRKPETLKSLDNTSDAMKISGLLQNSLLMVSLKLDLPLTAKELLKAVKKFSLNGRYFIFSKLRVGRI